MGKNVALPVLSISEQAANASAKQFGLPRPLSASSIETLHKCGFSWAFRYLLHSPSRGGAESAIGSAHHAALRLLNLDFHKGKIKPSSPVVKYEREFSKTLNAEAKRLVVKERRRVDATKEEVRAVLFEWKHWLLQHAKPADVQLVEVDQLYSIFGYPMRLILDLLLPDRVIDFKTTASTRKKQWAKRFQFKLYALAANRRKVDVAVVQRAGRHTTIDITTINYVMPKLRREVEWTIRTAAQVIKARAFTPPDPESWYCSNKWCEHWARCRGGMFAEELRK